MKSEEEIRETMEKLYREMDSLIDRIVNSPLDSPQSEIEPVVRKLAATAGKIEALRWTLGDRDDLF